MTYLYYSLSIHYRNLDVRRQPSVCRQSKTTVGKISFADSPRTTACRRIQAVGEYGFFRQPGCRQTKAVGEALARPNGVVAVCFADSHAVRAVAKVQGLPTAVVCCWQSPRFADSHCWLSANYALCRHPLDAVGKHFFFFLNCDFKFFFLPRYIVYNHMFEFGPFWKYLPIFR